ncbi:AglZ/HisF2 family acetamidino modification protein [Carboxylicivirga sp. N1Y90]|uniref:AglZ/HisF2 family acetamidino modification protein n=1 Tax=Carboxylicivirga fragile TaxID=3417571 RepID=UPI003D3458E0|nr:imidazole glycerol phosphate synthase subunit HisF [Marinilabiliaceae bacterium N1Y90]
MRRVRVIPALLLQDGGLVKTICFSKANYIGDPINAVRIFNDKEVDELVILDISATPNKRRPNFNALEDMVSEAFMPLAYGGGLKTLDDIKRAFDCGIEKVVLNSITHESPELITEAARIFGNQSIVVAVDVKLGLWGKYKLVSNSRQTKHKEDIVSYCQRMESAGAGEIMLTAVHHEGTFKGYDTKLINALSHQINIPLVANGGARNIEDFKEAIDAGASAVAAGSRFVYTGRENGIMINYPKQEELKTQLFEKL